MSYYCAWCEEEIFDEDEMVYSDSDKLCCCGECAVLQDEEDYQNEIDWED